MNNKKNVFFLCFMLSVFSSNALAGITGKIPLQWFNKISTSNTSSSNNPFKNAFYGQTSMSKTSNAVSTTCSNCCPTGYSQYLGGFTASDFNVNSSEHTYACEPNTINLTWNKNGHGTAPTNLAACFYDDSITAPSMSENGYTFNGWKINNSTTAAGGSIPCTSARLGVSSGTATLVGQWAGNTVYMTWAKGDHAASSATNTSSNCTYGQTFTTPAALTGATGYTFDGWKFGSTTTKLNASQSYDCNYSRLSSYGNNSSSPVAFTAQWKAKTINCAAGKYVAAGVDTCNTDCNVNSTTGNLESGYYCPANNSITYTGNEQNRLSCSADTDGKYKRTSTQAGATASAVTQCRENINFYGNGTNVYYPAGSGGTTTPVSTQTSFKTLLAYYPASTTYVSGCDSLCQRNNSGFYLTGFPVVIRDNYVFKGWTQDAAGTGDYVETGTASTAPSSSNIFSETINLHAQWDEAHCVAGNGVDSVSTSVDSTNNRVVCAVTCQTGYSRTGGTDTTVQFDVNGTTGVGTVNVSCVARIYGIKYYIPKTYNPSLESDWQEYSGLTPTSYTVNSGTLTLPTAISVNRPGYDFGGWYPKSACTVNNARESVCTGSAITSFNASAAADKEFYAKTTSHTYTVNYKCHPNDSTYATLADPTKGQRKYMYTYFDDGLFLDYSYVCPNNGYDTTQWQCTTDGVNYDIVDAGAPAAPEDGVWDILYDVTCQPYDLQPREYSVTYNCGDGNTGTPPPSTSAVYDSNFRTAINTCSKTGNTFAGWAVSNTSDVKPADTGFTWNYTENKELTATWTTDIYTINLDAGSNATTPGTTVIYEKYGVGFYNNNAASGDAITSITPPTRSGYSFKGYYGSYFENSGSGHFTLNDTLVLIPSTGDLTGRAPNFSSPTTLYAHWIKDCANVSNGSCNIQCVNDTGYSSCDYITACESGYLLASGGGTYNPICEQIQCNISHANNIMATVNQNNSVTCTATCDTGYSQDGNGSNSSYTITGSQNQAVVNGACLPNSYQIEMMRTGNDSANVYVYTKYDIAAYNNPARQSANELVVGGSNTVDAPTALTYTVTYQYHDGTTPDSSDTLNRVFNGYYAAVTGGNPYIAPDGTITSDGLSAAKAVANNSTKWYAQWGNASVTLPAPTYSGHNFIGWYDAETGGNKFGDANVSYPVTGNITLHARWETTSKTINFHANGGGSVTESCASVTCNYTDSNCLLQTWNDSADTSVKCNFTNGTTVLVGWTNVSGGTTKVYDLNQNIGTSGTNNLASVPSDLYAVWADTTCSGTNVNQTQTTALTPENNTPICNFVCNTGYKTSGKISGTANTASVTHDCTPKTIVCENAGEYLPANSETCAPCLAGSYCPNPANTQYTYTGAAQGIYDCPTTHPNSTAGANAKSLCYKNWTCTSNDWSCPANAHDCANTPSSGIEYYKSGNTEHVQCDVQYTCNAGYNNTFLDNYATQTITEYGYRANNGMDDFVSVINTPASLNYTNLEPGEWYKQYADGTVIKGTSLLGTYFIQSDTIATQSCWCKITSYKKQEMSDFISVDSQFVYDSSFSADWAKYFCASRCGLPVSSIKQCDANEIPLNWSANGGTAGNGDTYTPETAAQSCIFNTEDGLTIPSNPIKTGHTFMGWEIINN